MAPGQTTKVAAPVSSGLSQRIDPLQTSRATTALLRKIQTDQATRNSTAEKPTSLLADADEDEVEDDVPIWLVLTTKKHIVDKKRLKPGKIVLPHPCLDASNPNLRICLITADPQRTYKDLIAHPSFPLDLAKRVGRVIGLSKLKAKYKSFESRRQLLGEYDVFLADDRVITYLPQVLGKVFYKSGSKRPVPITLEGKRQSHDEHGNKRRKLSEGGSKVLKSEVKPTAVAHEIQRTLASALVHLAPSTTTAVKVGKASMNPAQVQQNVDAVTQGLVDKYVPQKWNNVRAIHIKGPETAALPIWLTEELWEDTKDVLEELPPVKEGKKSKKRKLGALADVAAQGEIDSEIIEVPGPDGKMRRLEKRPAAGKGSGAPKVAVKKIKQSKNQPAKDDIEKIAEKAEKAARKEALRKQKAAAKANMNGLKDATEKKDTQNGDTEVIR